MSRRVWPPLPPPGRPAFLPGNFGMPVGTVIIFAGQLGASAPHVTSNIETWGWTLCDGRVLKIGDYPALFVALGNTYDAASVDGSFQLPDYRGFFLRGADGGSGNDPDAGTRTTRAGATSADVGSQQTDAFCNHEHGVDPSGAPTLAASGTPAKISTGPSLVSQPMPVPLAGISGHETRPKNIAVNYLIKFM